MTKEMYEDLLERNKLQISELNTLTEEQDRHIVELEKENAELKEQIEKMKCCENCCHYSHTYEHCYSTYLNCKSLSNWRLAEC